MPEICDTDCRKASKKSATTWSTFHRSSSYSTSLRSERDLCDHKDPYVEHVQLTVERRSRTGKGNSAWVAVR